MFSIQIPTHKKNSSLTRSTHLRFNQIMKLCAIVNGPTQTLAEQQLQEACLHADLAEIRLDLFDSIQFCFIRQLQTMTSLPLIFTLRPIRQGGKFGGKFGQSEEERLKLISSLATLKPAFLDLESDVPAKFYRTIKTNYPTIQIIASTHDFESTPEALQDLLKRMLALPADRLKNSRSCPFF